MAWEEANSKESSTYEIQDGLLYQTKSVEAKQLVVVPKKRWAKMLPLVHGSPLVTHVGRCRTLDKLSRQLYWPGMTSDVWRLVKECTEWQRGNKSKLGKAPLVNLPVISTPFERVAIDVVGPMPVTVRKNCYIYGHGYSVS